MKANKVGFLFIMPSFVGILIFVLLPFIDVVRRSVTNTVSGTFIGFENYKSVLNNEAFRLAVANTLRFSLICIPLLIVLSLFMAVLVSEGASKLPFLKMVFLIPMAIPVASVTLLWKIIFHENGLLSSFLAPYGLNIDWMNSSWSFWILVLSYIWKNLGYDMILWIAGLASISPSLYEAAAVDGAGKVQTFFHITLPNLMPTFYTITVLSLLNSFKVFREAYLVAGNYPHEDMYLIQHVFNNWFTKLDMDKLSAGAVLMAVVILMLILLLKKVWEEY